jgi:hypothetical protein
VETVGCAQCGKEFEKSKSEFNRSEKKGMRHFCSNTCSTIIRNKELPVEEFRKYCYNISKRANNHRDEFSPFRKFLNKGGASMKKHRSELDVKYLKELWNSQNGVCPYTGIKMLLPKTTSHMFRSPKKQVWTE